MRNGILGLVASVVLGVTAGIATADLSVDQQIKLLDIKERSTTNMTAALQIYNNPASSAQTKALANSIGTREQNIYDRCEKLLNG